MKRERRNGQRIARKRGPHKDKRVLLRGLAGGAAMAVGTHAYAVPVGIYLGDDPIILSNWFDLDVNNDDQADLEFSHFAIRYPLWDDDGPSGVFSAHAGYVEGLNAAQFLVTAEEGTEVVRRFAANDLIGPGGYTQPLASYKHTLAAYLFSSSPPEPPYVGQEGQFGNERGLMGFKFDIGGQEHWGWVETEVVFSSESPCCSAVKIYGWGYETEAEMGILAGAPEPGTLAALAIGAAAVLGRRRTAGG